MKKFIILIPVYNDWKSLIKLLDEINHSIKDINECSFKCIIINDASTLESPELVVPKNISSIKVITMKKNCGHARCNAFGLRYLSKNIDYDYLIVMDGDGEDRPEEIKDLVKQTFLSESTSVVAKRVKRSEGSFFQLLYKMHKVITFLFTGKKINFGNYSCLTKKDVNILSNKASLWSSFSGSVKNHIEILEEINSIRGTRYFGPSKMSLFKLGIHSFSIIAVFKNIVFLRSTIIIILLSFSNTFIGLVSTILQILLVIFNLMIFLVSLRESEKDLLNSDKNEKTAIIYTH
jgi:hypothetical protein|tara:strand:- start:940 stop:1812 length:873 start_codon:yes stop_codon:yes gene_type:complete